MYNQLSESAEFYNQLWGNDTQYRKLVATADYYLNLYEMGVDCEQELLDAMLDAYVHGLQARYGDDWRAYAQPNVLMAYDWMMMRKKQSNEEELVVGSGGSGGSPPRPEPV